MGLPESPRHGVEVREEHECFGGRLGYYSHASVMTGTRMNFAVFVPPQARVERVPALYYLAGLTCSEETFMIKAGAQRLAAELGLMLVTCDTSPRGLSIPGDSDHWDFGVAAGFYVDAVQAPMEQNKLISVTDAEIERTAVETRTSAPLDSLRRDELLRFIAWQAASYTKGEIDKPEYDYIVSQKRAEVWERQGQIDSKAQELALMRKQQEQQAEAIKIQHQQLIAQSVMAVAQAVTALRPQYTPSNTVNNYGSQRDPYVPQRSIHCSSTRYFGGTVTTDCQ